MTGGPRTDLEKAAHRLASARKGYVSGGYPPRARYVDGGAVEDAEDAYLRAVKPEDLLALLRRLSELEQAIAHVVDDSPGTPESVKGYLRAALRSSDSAAAVATEEEAAG